MNPGPGAGSGGEVIGPCEPVPGGDDATGDGAFVVGTEVVGGAGDVVVMRGVVVAGAVTGGTVVGILVVGETVAVL